MEEQKVHQLNHPANDTYNMKNKVLQIRISDRMHRALNNHAAQNKTSVSKVTRKFWGKLVGLKES